MYRRSLGTSCWLSQAAGLAGQGEERITRVSCYFLFLSTLKEEKKNNKCVGPSPESGCILLILEDLDHGGGRDRSGELPQQRGTKCGKGQPDLEAGQGPELEELDLGEEDSGDQ